MANPLVPQGFLNRVRGAVSITDVPALNVTASYLGKDGISMRPDGPATDILPTMTGTVGSQVPYQQVTLTVHRTHAAHSGSCRKLSTALYDGHSAWRGGRYPGRNHIWQLHLA